MSLGTLFAVCAPTKLFLVRTNAAVLSSALHCNSAPTTPNRRVQGFKDWRTKKPL